MFSDAVFGETSDMSTDLRHVAVIQSITILVTMEFNFRKHTSYTAFYPLVNKIKPRIDTVSSTISPNKSLTVAWPNYGDFSHVDNMFSNSSAADLSYVRKG